MPHDGFGDCRDAGHGSRRPACERALESRKSVSDHQGSTERQETEDIQRERLLKLTQRQSRRGLRIRRRPFRQGSKTSCPTARERAASAFPSTARCARHTAARAPGDDRDGRHAADSHAPGRANETPCHCRRARSVAGRPPATAGGISRCASHAVLGSTACARASATEVAHGGSSDTMNPATIRVSHVHRQRQPWSTDRLTDHLIHHDQIDRRVIHLQHVKRPGGFQPAACGLPFSPGL